MAQEKIYVASNPKLSISIDTHQLDKGQLPKYDTVQAIQ
ncbi:hypothetical protein DSUL_60233 [Desulfovibrionales bacterium]